MLGDLSRRIGYMFRKHGKKSAFKSTELTATPMLSISVLRNSRRAGKVEIIAIKQQLPVAASPRIAERSPFLKLLYLYKC